MNGKNIDLLKTKNYGNQITSEVYSFYSQAAAVCLEENNHKGNALLQIEGELSKKIALTWELLSRQLKDMHNDLIYAAEHGAYCIAFLIIHNLTDYKVIKQSKRRTGFDYWLGDKEEELPFTNKARLEVSGILSGNNSQINKRVKDKSKQTKQSDYLNLPAFIIVTEFSKPISIVLKK